MKINKLKPHLQWSRGARRENAHVCDTQQPPLTQEEKYLASPTGSDTSLLPHRRKKRFSLAQ